MKTNERRLRSALDARGLVAMIVSLLLIPCGQPGLYAQGAANYVPLGVEQLNQLVAPIALYPDSLVAQTLTAATYPQQVSEADAWIGQNAGLPPEQRAAAADTMPWDPSVKALTAFPTVLDSMGKNIGWTEQLGNAYYNQPGDVMNAVQAMRLRAQEAGTLRSDNHYRVAYDGGLVVIQPVNPAFVYVPYYNPWLVYGGPLVAWPGYYWGPPRGYVGGLGLAFATGVALGVWANYAWGYHRWEPNWHGGVVVYNHTTYISNSTTVVNRGNFGYHNRGVYERPGPGVPHNFRPAVTAQSAAFRPGQGRPGDYRNSQYTTPRTQGQQGAGNWRQYGQPGQQTPQNNNPGAGRQFGQNRQNPTTPTQPVQGGQNPRFNQTPRNPQNMQPQQQSPRQFGQQPSNVRQPGAVTPQQPQVNRPQGQYTRPPQTGGTGGGNNTYHPPQNSSNGTYRQGGGNTGGTYHSQGAAPRTTPQAQQPRYTPPVQHNAPPPSTNRPATKR